MILRGLSSVQIGSLQSCNTVGRFFGLTLQQTEEFDDSFDRSDDETNPKCEADKDVEPGYGCDGSTCDYAVDDEDVE